MRPIVMRFDMLKVGRVFECWIIPVQVLHPAIDIRVVVLATVCR